MTGVPNDWKIGVGCRDARQDLVLMLWQRKQMPDGELPDARMSTVLMSLFRTAAYVDQAIGFASCPGQFEAFFLPARI